MRGKENNTRSAIQERNLLVRFVFNKGVELWEPPRVTGKENVLEAVEFSQALTPVIFVGNHGSNLDGLEVFHALYKIDKDFAKRLIFIKGVGLHAEWFPNMVSRTVDFVDVVPRKRLSEDPLERREQLTRNLLAVRVVRQAMPKGRAVVVFPEGGRNNNGNLIEADPNVARAFFIPGTQVYPVSIVGTEEIMPKGRHFPWPPRRLIAIHFGGRIDIDYLRESCPDDKSLVDYVMTQVAKELPQQYWGEYYRHVMEQFRQQEYEV